MFTKLNLVIILLFVLSAIVVLGSNDKTELLFHLLIVSVLGFFALYVYHKKTIEAFFYNDEALNSELSNEVNNWVQGFSKIEQNMKNDENNMLNGASSDYSKPFDEFDKKMLNTEALQELSLGERSDNQEFIGDGDYACAFQKDSKDGSDENTKSCKNKRFEAYDSGAKLYQTGALLDEKMGMYDNIRLDTEKLQHRKIMTPGVLKEMVPPTSEKCGDLSSPCSGVKIENPFHVNPDGDEVEMVFSQEDKMKGVVGHDELDQNMFVFSHNKCSPACCPSNYSCDGGCVCTDTQQRNMIGRRTNKSVYSL